MNIIYLFIKYPAYIIETWQQKLKTRFYYSALYNLLYYRVRFLVFYLILEDYWTNLDDDNNYMKISPMLQERSLIG